MIIPTSIKKNSDQNPDQEVRSIQAKMRKKKLIKARKNSLGQGVNRKIGKIERNLVDLDQGLINDLQTDQNEEFQNGQINRRILLTVCN